MAAKHDINDDLKQIAAKICKEAHNGRTIHILADSDTDGIMAGSILFAGLQRMNVPCELHEIDPKHAHKIQSSDLNKIDLKQSIKPDGQRNTDLLIVVDAGSTQMWAFNEKNGIKPEQTCVLDHHNTQNRVYVSGIKEANPAASSMQKAIDVNGNEIEDSGMCGATLAYKLVENVLKESVDNGWITPDTARIIQQDQSQLKICEAVALSAEKEYPTNENEKTLTAAATIASDMQQKKYDGKQITNFLDRLMTRMQDFVQTGLDKPIFKANARDQFAKKLAPMFSIENHMDLESGTMFTMLLGSDSQQKMTINDISKMQTDQRQIINDCMNVISHNDRYVYDVKDLSTDLCTHAGMNRAVASAAADILGHPVMLKTNDGTGMFAAPEDYPMTMLDHDGKERSLLKDMHEEKSASHQHAFTTDFRAGGSIDTAEQAMKEYDAIVDRPVKRLHFVSQSFNKQSRDVATYANIDLVWDQYVKDNPNIIHGRKNSSYMPASLTFKFSDMDLADHVWGKDNQYGGFRIGNLTVAGFDQTNAMKALEHQKPNEPITVTGKFKKFTNNKTGQEQIEFCVDDQEFSKYNQIEVDDLSVDKKIYVFER